MQKIHLTNLSLVDYRNFENFTVKIEGDLVLITGANGSGKTNILESISFLSPGRGIRSASFDELNRNYSHAWQSDIHLQSRLGLANIQSKFDLKTNRRHIQYNGAKSNPGELVNLLNVVWLTPQMDGLFISGASERRRFIDRVVFNFFPLHASNLNKLDHYAHERMRHLSHHQLAFDKAWLALLEAKIALVAKEIYFARLTAISYMQEAIDGLESKFPKAKVAISIFDQEISNDNFIEQYQKKLFESRNKDSHSGRNNYGVQKIDLLVTHVEKDKLANICSTGEQKAMLISIFLAQVKAIIDKTNASPILLLDELFVHLDELRKDYLSEYVINSRAQCFITATDDKGIEHITQKSQLIQL